MCDLHFQSLGNSKKISDYAPFRFPVNLKIISFMQEIHFELAIICFLSELVEGKKSVAQNS